MENSVPTTLCARSGNSTSSVSPKKTPLPTDVSPTMKPPKAPMRTAATRSRFVRCQSSSPGVPVWTRLFATSPIAPKSSAPPSTCAITPSTPSPYRSVIWTDAHTPTSDSGAEPRSIQPASCARTFPMRRCCTAPTVLKAAPWAMSVPIAVVGGTPKRNTRSGVISEPPPMPVIPTSSPVSSPRTVYFQSIA